MDVSTGTWFKFLREDKKRPKHTITEISEREAERLRDWVAEQGGIPNVNPEFDELFGGEGRMRVAFPMASPDVRNISQLVTALKEQGWLPRRQLGMSGKPNIFSVNTVKQKLKRRVGELPPGFVISAANPDPRPVETYEEDKLVAKLDLTKTYNFTIPAGPRKGEEIEKTDKTTMSRAIAGLAKKGYIGKELSEWWQKKQTFYTKDQNWEDIEELFKRGDEDASKYSIIISRHPMDVLRMSDIGNIRSCHREGGEYFKCAVAEYRGTGLVSYRVKTKELETFLRGRTDLDMAQDVVKTRILDHYERFAMFHDRLLYPDKWASTFEQVLEGFIAAHHHSLFYSLPKVRELITPEMVREAIQAKIDGKLWPPPASETDPPAPISDFDDEEIFLDRERKVDGIVAQQRGRLRKFYDETSDVWFAVPEHGTYGHKIPGFVDAFRQWAWDNQKDLFMDEEGTKIRLPDRNDLTRYGASYEDTNDGAALSTFFKLGGKRDAYDWNWKAPLAIPDGFGGFADIEEEEYENIADQWEEELTDIQATAEGRAHHIGFWAEVQGEFEAQVYIRAQVNAAFVFPLGWKGEMELGDDGHYRFDNDERDQTLIPHPWKSAWPQRRDLEALFQGILDANQIYNVEELNWSVITPRDPDYNPDLDDPSERNLPPALELSFHVDCDDCEDPDSTNYFFDNAIDEIDDNYDTIFEKFRRELVEEGYIAGTDFDRMYDDIEEANTELKNWDAIGIDEDDYDGEIEFLFKPDEMYPTPTGIIWPTEIGVTSTGAMAAKDLLPIFPLGGSVGRSIDRRQHWVSPGSEFMKEFAEKLRHLQEAANGYAEEQLDFAFGEKYKRPKFEGVSFGDPDTVKLELTLITQKTRGMKGWTVMFKFKVIVASGTEKEEIEGSLKFMDYIDQYPGMIHEAITSTLRGYLDLHIVKVTLLRASILNGTQMQKYYQRLDSKYGAQADLGNTDAEGAMLTAMWVRDNWEKMSDIEKETGVNYLAALTGGSLHPRHAWDADRDMPLRWNNWVKGLLSDRNAPDLTRQSYFWAGSQEEEEEEEPEALRGRIGEPVPAGAPPEAARLARGGDRPMEVHYVSDDVAPVLMRARMGLSPAEAEGASLILYGPTLSDEERFKAMGALVAGNKEEFMRIIGNRDVRQLARGGDRPLEEQIHLIDEMLNEKKVSGAGRKPIDLRIYKVDLGCVVDFRIAGRDSQIENQIRGIDGVTTVRHLSELQKSLGPKAAFRVYEIKFEIYGQQARDTYRDSVLVQGITSDVRGVTVRERGQVHSVEGPLREFGQLGTYDALAPKHSPSMVTPAISLDSVLEDWVEGGVQVYDTPMNTNQMQYHVMMPVEDLWKHASRYYRGTKTDFDGRYKYFIASGPQMPVYIALGQNGRARITGNEDLIWFARKSGLQELPVFFSYQKQV